MPDEVVVVSPSGIEEKPERVNPRVTFVPAIAVKLLPVTVIVSPEPTLVVGWPAGLSVAMLGWLWSAVVGVILKRPSTGSVGVGTAVVPRGYTVSTLSPAKHAVITTEVVN